MKEEWQPIKGMDGRYEVSSLGNIRSLDRFVKNPGNPNGGYRQPGRMLKICTAKNGYSVVNIGRRQGTKYVHRLVAETFIGDIPDGMTVNHKNGDKSNNRVENLEIVTYRQNHLHAFRELGRVPTCTGKTNTNASKPILQLKNGTAIASFPSAREAERQTGINFKRISACCHGRAHTAGGYGWRFENSTQPDTERTAPQK